MRVWSLGTVTALWAATRVPLPQGEAYRHGHHDRRFNNVRLHRNATQDCLCVFGYDPSVTAGATELYSEGTRFEAWLGNHQSDAHFTFNP